jgi:hypothetical protein
MSDRTDDSGTRERHDRRHDSGAVARDPQGSCAQIDPETAEVRWRYVQIMEPYGVDPDLPKEYQCVGRGYFARSPGSDVWVSFDDLPKAIVEALWAKESEWHEEDDLSWLVD